MRPDSKQLKILKALTMHLEGINPSNIDPDALTPGEHYDLDLTNKVKRGRTVFGVDQPVPFIAILEKHVPNPTVGVGYERVKRKEDWDLLLQGFVEDDTANPFDPAYDLKGVVEHRLSQIVALTPGDGKPAFPDVYMLGGLITDLTIGQGIVSPPKDGVSAKAFFYMPVRLCVVTDVSNPFPV